MFKIRQKVKAIAGGTAPTPVQTSARGCATANSKPTKNKVNGKRGSQTRYVLAGLPGFCHVAMKSNIGSDEESMEDSDEYDSKAPKNNGNLSTPATSAKRQKTLGGKVTKRFSPRKMAKKDYSKLENPYKSGEVTDGNGDKIFENQKTESEDSYASDNEYHEVRESENMEYGMKVEVA